MIRLMTHADKISGIVQNNGRSVGGFWENSDGKWSVRLDGFPVSVVPTKKAVRALAVAAFPEE